MSTDFSQASPNLKSKFVAKPDLDLDLDLDLSLEIVAKSHLTSILKILAKSHWT